jgi:hypothetical protein
MIDFNYENEYNLDNEEAVGNWLSTVILRGRKKEKSLHLCDDEYHTKSILSI